MTNKPKKRDRRKKLTVEEIEANKLVRELRDLKEERGPFIPNPPEHVKFEVGDRVQHGSLDKSIITEVIDSGRIYLLHESTMVNHYGKPVFTERDMYVSWLEIEPYLSKEDLSKIEKISFRDTMQLNFCQMDMSSLFSKMYYFGVNMEPDYQRGNVWTMADKQKLISSVFLNVDIGKFVFISLPYKSNSPSYEVLDGKQRLIALKEFYECRYKFNGGYFKDMHRFDRRHFEGHPVSVATVGDERVKDSDKYKYFLRLNRGGRAQDPKHLKTVEKMYKEALEEGR